MSATLRGHVLSGRKAADEATYADAGGKEARRTDGGKKKKMEVDHGEAVAAQTTTATTDHLIGPSRR